jgi:hypothetical protein
MSWCSSAFANKDSGSGLDLSRGPRKNSWRQALLSISASRPSTPARADRPSLGPSAEDAHAAWTDEQPDDDEHDPRDDAAAQEGHDASDDEDRRDDPKDRRDSAST